MTVTRTPSADDDAAWIRCDRTAVEVRSTRGVARPEDVLAALRQGARRRADVSALLLDGAGSVWLGVGAGDGRRTARIGVQRDRDGLEVEVTHVEPPAVTRPACGWAAFCPDGVALCDADGFLQYVNPALDDLIAPESGAAVGRDLGAFLFDVTGRSWDDDWRAATDHGNWSGERLLRTPTRGAVPVDVSINLDPPTRRFVVLLRDLRHMRQHARAQASSASVDLITRLAAGLAHDVNNLAAQIVGWSRRALTTEDANVGRRALDEQARLGRDLGDVGWQLLGLTHTETLLSTADLCRVAREVGWLVERLSNRVRTVRVVQPPSTRPRGKSEQRVAHIGIPHPLAVGAGLQLAIRALEGSTPDSAIVVGARRLDGQATLYVTYEPVPAEAADIRGLLHDKVVRRLVDAALAERLDEADLWLDARELPGTIELSLTGRRHAEAARPLPTAVPATRVGGTVLIVDDNQSLRELMEELLKGAFGDVRTATDGVDALEQLSSLGGEVDLIVSDVMMPRMDGVDLCATVRERYPSIQFFLTSGVSLSPSAQARLPGVPFLRKPFELDELFGLLEAQADAQ